MTPPDGPDPSEAARRAVLARAVAVRPAADPRGLRALLDSLGYPVDAATLAADLAALGFRLEPAADGGLVVRRPPPPEGAGPGPALTAAVALVALLLVGVLGLLVVNGKSDVKASRAPFLTTDGPSVPATTAPPG